MQLFFYCADFQYLKNEDFFRQFFKREQKGNKKGTPQFVPLKYPATIDRKSSKERHTAHR